MYLKKIAQKMKMKNNFIPLLNRKFQQKNKKFCLEYFWMKNKSNKL